MSTGRTERLALAILAALLFAAPARAEARPNFVIIIIDDAGFTDLGAYGSEIRTPHIDALAEEGALFANFHATPTCAPSRAMLMTGVDSHLTGVPTLEHLMLPEHAGRPGYEGELNDSVATLAEHLSAAGYATYITGKWHLGHSPRSLPAARGFDRSFILDASGADNWEHRTYLPHYDRADWFEGLDAVDELPEDFYSSQFLVDRMIDYIGEGDRETPFLAIVGFQAIHIPVQAPREYVERYDGVYDSGWDALRRSRHAAAIERGLIPADAPLPEAPPGLRDWDGLSQREQRESAMNMQVAAGMLEAMDDHFGRLVSYLRDTGAYENTVFLVVSDNGPEHNDPTTRRAMRLWMAMQGYSRDPERLGEQGTYAFIGPEWAAAAASPLSMFKFHAGEGGTRTPLIVTGPGVEARGLTPGFSLISDIAPTILDLAGAAPLPGYLPFTGRSLTPVLSGEAGAVYGPEDSVGLEVSGQAALFRGDYKLVRNMAPYGDGRWRLFDLAADPGETRDLAGAMPDLFAGMLAGYADYEARFNVLPVPEDFDADARINVLGWAAAQRRYGPGLVLALLLIAALAGAAIVWRRRGRR